MSKKSKWISVEEGLPPSFKQVLVFGDYYGKNHMAEFSCCGDWQVNHWSTDRDCFPDMERIEITHWAFIDLPDNPRHAAI